MYSDYPGIVFYILLLLMLSGGIVHVARQSGSKFILQSLVWVLIFVGVFGFIRFLSGSF
jgi:hypothetical protein